MSEEMLYNVTAGEGHLWSGSLLHALVSSRTAANDVVCQVRKCFTQNLSVVWRDSYFETRYIQDHFAKTY